MAEACFQIIKTGWAVKLGQRVKSWKRRWFVLLGNGHLRYFVDKSTYIEQGCMILTKNTCITVSCATSSGVPINIVNKKRTLIMTCETHAEAEDWYNKLKDVCDTLEK
ncbi:PH domain containing protein [Trichomonas vaginalis G3]|uniref:PH domain containing protein n=1 Tax=Trichomonas vaginalis (strain ATCC PRA-98 / G3) TaxID=412133 RepID=A2FS37_TRIV3|nr:PH domain-like family [Trichomonas vaginalis G3]EAX92279.1 PH domain containing protein [Trichomonas vaginalis G3]KAI5530128.1 PH domain-like family [Trichomonas vaginalis G3]|eukprot:XP_001305209.1 PH domain containing protein [Trichomonas vaginalis G3]